jgi:hypothetical protein
MIPEAAFLNDRYAGLAVVVNFVVTNDVDEDLYLSTYFGAPSPSTSTRFFLMEQIVHMFHVTVFMLQRRAEDLRGARVEDAVRIVQ